MRATGGYWAFQPNPLPPKIHYDDQLIRLLSESDRLLGELSGTGRLLPNPYLLINPYIRREAVSSSKIEGTESSLRDLFYYEAEAQDRTKSPDAQEVYNYVLAMEHGLHALKDLPISIRKVRSIHKVLMQGVRGERLTPGELRKDQNWIGPFGCDLDNATYVPPPPRELKQGLNDWETYLHSDAKEPPLVQCALIHYQFEALHPFLDGNGRIGRLVIIFFLCERDYLTQPLLYLSSFFERNRTEYYEKLLGVSQQGNWYAWISFFLRGVVEQCKSATEDATKILALHKACHDQLKQTKMIPDTAHRLVDEVFFNPYVSISRLSKKWNVSYNTVKSGVQRLVHLGILEEFGARQRNKIFVAPLVLEVLTRG